MGFPQISNEIDIEIEDKDLRIDTYRLPVQWAACKQDRLCYKNNSHKYSCSMSKR